MKEKNNKGFTLAELLIVVAILGVLIAIAMPTFTSQLGKAKIAADKANLRAAYAEAVAIYLDESKNPVEIKDVNLSGELKDSKDAEDLPFTVSGLPGSGKSTVVFTFSQDSEGRSVATAAIK